MNTVTFWENFMLPVAICVILPVLIVYIVGRVRKNETDRKAEIMLKAIENGATVDPNFFSPAKKQKTIKQELLEKLNGALITGLMGLAFLLLYFLGATDSSFGRFLPFAGAMMLAVGIGLFVSYYVGKKMLAGEIEAEEEKKQASQD